MRAPRKIRRLKRLPLFRQPLLARLLNCGSQTTRQPAGNSHCCGHRLYCPRSFCKMANCPCGLSKGLLNSIQTPLLNKRLPEGHQPLRQPTAPAKRIVSAVNLTPENRLLSVCSSARIARFARAR